MRKPADVAALISKFNHWQRCRPDDGMVVALLDVGTPGTGYKIDLGSVDCTALHYVALADACLDRASECLRAAGQLELVLRIEQARAALDLLEPTKDA